MKRILSITFLWLFSVSLHAEKKGYRFEIGEDATSRSFYLVFLEHSTVTQVRMIWNGGAQNKPTVTDYRWKSGKLEVTHMTGDRKLITQLVQGKEPKMEAVSSYVLVTGRSPGMLLPTGEGEKTLTESQRVDLGNLIWVLAMERSEDSRFERATK